MANYTTYQIPKVIDPITYSKPPKPPTGEAGWLSRTISQPYFPAVDLNPYLIAPVNASLYFKAPPAPKGTGSWLSQTISQPYFPAIDINPYLVCPANVTSYFKPPTFIYVTNSTQHQPVTSNTTPIPNVFQTSTYSRAPPPTGAASWLSKSISQPYFTPYDVNSVVYPANVATYSKAVNKAETLQENFDFGGLDSGKWISFGNTITVGTNLDAEFTTNNNYIGISSLSLYNLTGSYMYSQVVDAGNQTLASFEVYPVYLIADSNNKLYIRISGNTVQPIKVVAGVATNIGSGVSYNSATMKYFRIRESGGTTYFEYAVDPTSTWTNPSGWNVANPIVVTSLTLEILVGTWNLENSTAKLDNVNTYPTQYQFSWNGNTWNKRIHQSNVSGQVWTPNNVTGPDGSGYMTVKITNPDGAAPLLAEFFSNRRGFGYGTYTTVIATELDNIGHPSSFGGMFTFDFTAPPDYKEIDVNEVRDYNSIANKQILKSHAYNNGGSRTFITDNMDVNSSVVQTHRMIWTPTSITFDSFIGQGTGGTNYFHAVHSTNLPTPGLERVHFNIWVDPSIAGYLSVPELDVIIRSFDFEPLGYPGWVTNTIAQPYFTPYDVNIFGVPPVNVSTYFKPPPPPKPEAEWLPTLIEQPYFTPWDENTYGIPPVNPTTYFKPPPAPVGTASWLYRTISQPFFTPYDINGIVYPANIATYAKTVPPANPEAEWLPTLIEQPYFTPYDPNTLVYPANPATYSNPPAFIFVTSSTISQPVTTNTTPIPNVSQAATYFKAPPAPVGTASWLTSTISQPYFTPYDPNVLVSPASPATYSKTVPPPKPEAEWLPSLIEQPYFIPYDVNTLVYPASPATYFKPPPPPTPEAEWLPTLIEQPYFPAIDINPYCVSTPNVSTYFAPPAFIFTSTSTQHQPITATTYLIPNVQNPLKSLPLAVNPSWFTSTISQPIFTTPQTPVYPADISTYKSPPPAPKGAAAWFSNTIGQPYFTPYDVNSLVWPASPATYFKPVPPPVPEVEWLPSLIEQPFFTPYDVNNLVYPANPATYFKAPSAPIGSASWLSRSISQPYFTPFDPNQYVWNPNAGNLRALPAAPSITAAWFKNTISQPYFTPYDPNSLVFPANPATYAKPPLVIFVTNSTIAQPVGTLPYLIPGVSQIGTYFKPPLPPVGEADWLPNVIEQPYFTPYNVNILVWPANPATYSKPPAPPSDEASWLPTLIEQPYFTPYDVNSIVWPTPSVTYSKPVPAPIGSASWLTRSIGQPYFTPFDSNLYVWNPNAGNLRRIVPIGYASWAANSIAQPFFTPYDVNMLVWNASAGYLLAIIFPVRPGNTTVMYTKQNYAILAQQKNNTVIPSKKARTFFRVRENGTILKLKPK